MPSPHDPPNWDVFNQNIRCVGDDRYQRSVGDVIFLEKWIAGLPYPSGFWVLCQISGASCYVALVSSKKELGLYAIDNWYRISVEDLGAFIWTGNVAAVPPPSELGLLQDHEL